MTSKATNAELRVTHDDKDMIISVAPNTYEPAYWHEHRVITRIGSTLVGFVLAIGLACLLL